MKKVILLILLNLLIFSTLKSQKTYVPDDNFEQKLISLGLDTLPLDDSVVTSNIDTLTVLNIDTYLIYDLTGIEAFTSLTKLDCDFNYLDSLDLSANTALKELSAYNARMDYLNISNCVSLTDVNCNYNSISNLDVSSCTSLVNLFCSHNNIDSIDVSNNLALTRLNLYGNTLKKIDVSNNVSLKTLGVSGIDLTTLDVSNNLLLERLDCSKSSLTYLDLSNNAALTYLDCYINELEYLDISNGNNINITHLDIQHNDSLFCLQVDNPTYSTTNWIGGFAGLNFIFDSWLQFNLSCTRPCQAKFHPTQLTAGGVYLIDSTTGNNLKYKWYFGDGDSSSTYLPTHTYASAGSYNVCLQITDTIGGCTDIFCDTIKVDSTGILRNSWTLTVVKSQPVLSIAEEVVSSLSVFPNPATGVLNIEFENTGNYSLFSIDGKQVLKNGRLNATVTSIDISNLNTGMYLLRVVTDKGNVITKRVVKQ